MAKVRLERKTSTAKPTLRAERRPRPIPRDVREFLATRVAGGFDSPSEIIQTAFDDFAEELEGIRKADLQLAIGKLLEAHAKRQARWRRPTDCDRLDKAFRALDEQGIVARQNWTSCVTDGVDEIAGEVKAARRSGRDVRGWVFYHSQDTDDATEGGGLSLVFGPATKGSKKQALEVGRAVVETCRAEGLEALWDDDISQRIALLVDWKRRRRLPRR